MYERYFGFKKNPFTITSDPKFLYLSRSHEEALAHLLYGIEQKRGFLTITGEVGTGKTTICRALFQKLAIKTKYAFIFNPGLSEDDLLLSILADFGVKVKIPNRFIMFKLLNQFLIKQLKKGYNVILVIDEAQNLSVSALELVRMLSNLETESEKLFQIILVGQPELQEKLNLPQLRQLRQRIGVRYNIKALEEIEISAYVYHRITIAGGKQKILFAPEALKKLYDYSQGIPRIINVVCDKVLLQGFVKETPIITEGMIDESIHEVEGGAL